MFSPRPLAEAVWASAQIALEDLPELAAMGVRRVVNNRPDGEDAGQPSSAEMEAAVRAAGLDYVHAPVSGIPGPDAVRAAAEALEADEPVLMYCRSGTRSTIAWALAMRALGRAEADEIRAAAANAGYDLTRLPL
ncbi:TIGR01244 family sulfur transferase [Brevundimonas sp. NIBR11]|uniref:TIGR01244 family sulfur transferase n=1 Tax=Brevundimonas sp. NIBR11 TaxID=3015999 RepID=UPI0022F03F42|nr:TIGR01244 family sulfur transferase [Brevundimonas sp. NIBR11]WGM31656.1 Beta-lactamase hydrolase-like protein [Brevundimonas sp. NIBR11]